MVTPSTPLFPASELTLMYFATHLSSKLQFRSIKLYLASVKSLHLEYGYYLDFKQMFQLRRLLKGLKRQLGSKKRERQPITFSILQAIHDLIKPAFCNDLTTVMLWAAFTLAFYGFLRVSEFTLDDKFNPNYHLSLNDITFHPNIQNPEHLTLNIKQSKTDPFREGIQLTIAKSGTDICAVLALRDYLLQKPYLPAQGPLFTLESGKPLTRSILTANLRSLLHLIGLKDSAYASHSFRIGAATSAGTAGLPPWLIKTLGRWKSNCFELYIRTPKEVLMHVPRKLAQTAL